MTRAARRRRQPSNEAKPQHRQVRGDEFRARRQGQQDHCAEASPRAAPPRKPSAHASRRAGTAIEWLAPRTVTQDPDRRMTGGGPTTAFLLVLLGATVIGPVVAAAMTNARPVARVAGCVIPALAMIVACGWWTSLVVKPVYGSWSGARLAPALALRVGYPLYPPVDGGPINGWIYPPVGVLAYLPATFARDPVLMILAARGLTVFFVLGPVGILLARAWREHRIGATTAFVLFALFALLAQVSRPLRYVSTEVLSDAVALGLGALALSILEWHRSAPRNLQVAWAAALATLAVLSKQPALPILAVVPLWSLATGGLPAFRRASAITATVAVAIATPIVLGFGARALFFNTVVIPGHHPWQFPDVATIGDALARALDQERTILLFPIFALLVVAGALVRRREGFGMALPSLAWPPFLLASVMECPMAVAGYAKLGGDVNSLAHVLYPLTIAALLLVADAVVLAPRVEWLVLVGTLALAIRVAHGEYVTLAATPAWHDEWVRGPSWIQVERSVTRFLRNHPGEAYFPTYPLEHLVVEGRLPHFEHGVFDRAIAGFPPTPEELRRYVPRHARYLCYPMARSYTAQFMRTSLPEFDRRVQLPELADALCFERSPTTALP
jgi:hypothetical protein